MPFSLKPALLEKATDTAKIQKLMKADLKGSVGKKGVKFVAAKNCLIGKKAISLFIVTDVPTLYETLLKTKFPKALRAKGVCDVLPGAQKGTTQVTIKTSSGQISGEAIAKLVRPAVGSETSIQAAFGPAAKPDGVADWAKNEYRRKAKRTLMASMTPNGKIGSVYFKDGSRIRTTHGAGPAREKHGGQATIQFNVKNDVAVAYYEKKFGKTIETGEDWDAFDEWLANALNNSDLDNLPDWVVVVRGPETAHDLSQGKPTGEFTLFEIFKNINGGVESWHPSRGTATKFETDKQTISVLKAAIKHLKAEGLEDPGERNVAFYNFVKSRLPKFVPFMREPDKLND